MKKTILVMMVLLMAVGVSAEYILIEPDAGGYNNFGANADDDDYDTFVTGLENSGKILAKYYSEAKISVGKEYYMRRKYNLYGIVVESYWKIPDDCLDQLEGGGFLTYDSFFASDNYIIFSCYDIGGYSASPYIYPAGDITQGTYYENDLYEYTQPKHCHFKGQGHAYGRFSC